MARNINELGHSCHITQQTAINHEKLLSSEIYSLKFKHFHNYLHLNMPDLSIFVSLL